MANPSALQRFKFQHQPRLAENMITDQSMKDMNENPTYYTLDNILRWVAALALNVESFPPPFAIVDGFQICHQAWTVVPLVESRTSSLTSCSTTCGEDPGWSGQLWHVFDCIFCLEALFCVVDLDLKCSALMLRFRQLDVWLCKGPIRRLHLRLKWMRRSLKEGLKCSKFREDPLQKKRLITTSAFVTHWTWWTSWFIAELIYIEVLSHQFIINPWTNSFFNSPVWNNIPF